MIKDRIEPDRVRSDFLGNEIKRLCGKNLTMDMFKELESSHSLDALFNNHIAYKFDRTRKVTASERLELICRTSLLEGPQYVQALLQKIQLQREVLVLDLEQGMECALPSSLSQRNLPSSYRYYDGLLRSIQSLVSGQRMRTSTIKSKLIE